MWNERHLHFPKAILVCLPSWIQYFSTTENLEIHFRLVYHKNHINSFPPKSNLHIVAEIFSFLCFLHDRFKWKIMQSHIKYFTTLNLTPWAYQELLHFLELKTITLHFLWFILRLYFVHSSTKAFSRSWRPVGIWQINEYWILSLKKEQSHRC